MGEIYRSVQPTGPEAKRRFPNPLGTKAGRAVLVGLTLGIGGAERAFAQGPIQEQSPNGQIIQTVDKRLPFLDAYQGMLIPQSTEGIIRLNKPLEPNMYVQISKAQYIGTEAPLDTNGQPIGLPTVIKKDNDYYQRQYEPDPVTGEMLPSDPIVWGLRPEGDSNIIRLPDNLAPTNPSTSDGRVKGRYGIIAERVAVYDENGNPINFSRNLSHEELQRVFAETQAQRQQLGGRLDIQLRESYLAGVVSPPSIGKKRESSSQDDNNPEGPPLPIPDPEEPPDLPPPDDWPGWPGPPPPGWFDWSARIYEVPQLIYQKPITFENLPQPGRTIKGRMRT